MSAIEAGEASNVVELSSVKEEIAIHVYLEREMQRRGMSKTQLADDLGVHRQTIYKIISGKRPISYNLAQKLSTRFPVKADFWLNERVRVSKPSSSAPQPRPILDKNESSTEAPMLKAHAASSFRSPQILVDFQIREAIAEKGIEIEKYDEKNIHSASVDLVVGSMTAVPIDQLKREDFNKTDPVTLEPLQGINVIAAEKLKFSKNYLARVGAIAANSMRGLQVLHGFQVDPGFEGNMVFRAVNLGTMPILLDTGMPILSLEIVKLAVTPDKVFKAEESKRLNKIGVQIDDGLYALVEPEKTEVGDYRVFWDLAGIETISKSRSKAMDEALGIIYQVMRGGNEVAGYDGSVICNAIYKILSNIRLNSQDAQLLIRKANVTDTNLLNAVSQPFRGNDGALQSFSMICRKAKIDPFKAALAYIDIHPWSDI